MVTSILICDYTCICIFMLKTIAIERDVANQLKEFAERKHGFTHGAIKREAEEAIKKHIAEGVHG